MDLLLKLSYNVLRFAREGVLWARHRSRCAWMRGRRRSSGGAKTKYARNVEAIRTLQRIEDETDLRTWHEAKAELDADPQVRTADEMARKHL